MSIHFIDIRSTTCMLSPSIHPRVSLTDASYLTPTRNPEQDGTQFDSSRDRGQEFKFVIGQQQVIKGWDLGFATMKVRSARGMSPMLCGCLLARSIVRLARPRRPPKSHPPTRPSHLQVGEHAILKCRADYAYGEHGSPPTIPGGATLNFDVELIRYVLFMT